MGFATGSTPVGTYQELVRLHKEGILDFSGITSFNLDEYYGVPVTDPNSYRYFMEENLFSHVNIEPGVTNVPDGMAKNANEECGRYEEMIQKAGGIDLQLLGIGHNGHIGFNEPDSYFPANTHLVDLTESTIDANARFYQTRDEVPKQAVTMGIGTIMRAKSILLLAGGKDKADIIEKTMTGPITPQVPASILQLHPDVTVIQVL
jgi:glucosamine-6-phosphate deaminase